MKRYEKKFDEVHTTDMEVQIIKKDSPWYLHFGFVVSFLARRDVYEVAITESPEGEPMIDAPTRLRFSSRDLKQLR